MKSYRKNLMLTYKRALTIIFGSALAVVSLSAAAVAPVPICYDMTNSVPGPYGTSDEIVTPDLTVRINELRTKEGLSISNPAQFGDFLQSQIAGGVAPEYRGYLTLSTFIPQQPLSSVTMKIAINTHIGDGIYGNIGVNGELLILNNGLAAANNIIVSNGNGGQVLITTTLPLILPQDNLYAQWVSGELTLTALNGGTINRFSIGSKVYAIDDFCMTPQ